MSLSGRQRGAFSRIALRLLRRRNTNALFSSSSSSSFAPRSNTTVYALSCADERMCNDVKKRGDLRDLQMPLFGLGRSFAAAADASSVVARKKKTLKTGAVVGTTTNASSSSSSSSASNNATTNSMTRRQTKKLDLNPPTIPGVFDSIEDAAWNAAVAEVERERELEDIGEEDVRYDENGNVLNNPAAREEYRNTAAAASNSGNSPLSRFDYSLPVRAYYLGSTVDFRRLARELPTYPKEFTRECVVIRLAARRSVELASGGVGGNSSVSHLVNSGSSSSSSSSSSNVNDERKLNTLASLREAAEEVLNKRKKGVLKGENGEHILEQKDMETSTSAEETTTATAAATTTTTSPSQRGVGIPSTDLMRYMVVFKFGSVVFYNVGAQEREECLELTRNFVESPLAYPMKEDYLVKVSPRLDEWAKLESDHIVLKRLDVNNISVISAVLAQTVALEHYEHKVDAMVEIFSKLNKSTELTGDLNISKKRLFSLVAENNNTLTELITRLGLLGRSDTAWQYAQYNIVWEGLRQDFELEDRFQDLDYKLNLIQTQVKFYLEILQNRKSDFLEWTIIVLIALEICVSLYDMSDKLPSLPF
ncbi:predicted protein [Bathycoccus prasinos]|uniref:DUF155 domain-containing protein n=1 Tax=Bathycoccus prasinos TaxID=41875 RepID=K8F5H6_9CHLO|nr:predicted protein [Bathycoccus prasinos]CCO16808.1 predicted protein [Bathycoccus prasinos]|eukprot:XP_007513250.1 predicted protein [Bathycoccus prasinos]